MPKIDTTMDLAIIVVLVSLLSPSLTAFINNRFLLKVKKLEQSQKIYKIHVLHKREIFENYLSALNKCILHANVENLSYYGKYYSLAYIYSDDSARKIMSEANSLIQSSDYKIAVKHIDTISIEINEQLKNMFPQGKQKLNKLNMKSMNMD